MSDNQLKPGAHPPILVPYCGICDQPVERMRFDAVSSWYYLSIQASCCGRTKGARLSNEEVFRIKRSGEKFYIIPARAHVQTIKRQARM